MANEGSSPDFRHCPRSIGRSDQSRYGPLVEGAGTRRDADPQRAGCLPGWTGHFCIGGFDQRRIVLALQQCEDRLGLKAAAADVLIPRLSPSGTAMRLAATPNWDEGFLMRSLTAIGIVESI